MLLTSPAGELGIDEAGWAEAERWLAWLRCWYGRCEWPRRELPKRRTDVYV